MKALQASAAALVAAGWVAAPFLSMRRNGTLDEQHSGELELAAIRAECERAERAARTQVDGIVPEPRPAQHDIPVSRRV